MKGVLIILLKVLRPTYYKFFRGTHIFTKLKTKIEKLSDDPKEYSYSKYFFILK